MVNYSVRGNKDVVRALSSANGAMITNESPNQRRRVLGPNAIVSTTTMPNQGASFGPNTQGVVGKLTRDASASVPIPGGLTGDQATQLRRDHAIRSSREAKKSLADLEGRRITGEYGLQEARLRNEGLANLENIRGKNDLQAARIRNEGLASVNRKRSGGLGGGEEEGALSRVNKLLAAGATYTPTTGSGTIATEDGRVFSARSQLMPKDMSESELLNLESKLASQVGQQQAAATQGNNSSAEYDRLLDIVKNTPEKILDKRGREINNPAHASALTRLEQFSQGLSSVSRNSGQPEQVSRADAYVQSGIDRQKFNPSGFDQIRGTDRGNVILPATVDQQTQEQADSIVREVPPATRKPKGAEQAVEQTVVPVAQNPQNQPRQPQPQQSSQKVPWYRDNDHWASKPIAGSQFRQGLGQATIDTVPRVAKGLAKTALTMNPVVAGAKLFNRGTKKMRLTPEERQAALDGISGYYGSQR